MNTNGLTELTLTHYLKHEMAAPARAIWEVSKLLLKEATGCGHADFLHDTQSMCESAKSLADLLGTGLTPAQLKSAVTDGDKEDLFEIRTLLGQVDGYCEVLLQKARGMFVAPVVLMLELIHKHCNEINSSLVRLVQFGQEPDPVPVPPVKKNTGLFLLRKPGGALLVVDGNPLSSDTLVRRLKRQGHAVTLASHGAKAIDILASTDFDVILLDSKLPDMKGSDLLKRLKEDIRLRHVPVIMVSELDERQSAIECIQLGAEDYLCKPVDQVLLMARIGASLERRRLKDREFEQFFPPEIARQLHYRKDLLAGQELNVTVLFCDIRGFSRIIERQGPGKTVAWLSDVMERLSTCVLAHQGVLVDYIGDELLALWGAPQKQEDAERLACAAALDMLNQVPDLNQKWQKELGEAMDLGIGIHTGMAHVGNVGSKRCFKYGAHGNTVNLASRVQGATKYLKSRILVTQATWAALHDPPVLRRLGKVRVVNIQKPVEVYELSPAGRPHWPNLKQGYEQALAEFERQNFLGAIHLLSNLMGKYPDDGPSDLLLSQAVSLRQHLPRNFDGVVLNLDFK